MKAFLLAAGQGTRLQPYTNTVPKCLIPIHGRPLLEIWIDLLEHHGVTEVLINTHHLATEVEQFVAHHRKRDQGTADTPRSNQGFWAVAAPFGRIVIW